MVTAVSPLPPPLGSVEVVLAPLPVAGSCDGRPCSVVGAIEPRPGCLVGTRADGVVELDVGRRDGDDCGMGCGEGEGLNRCEGRGLGTCVIIGLRVRAETIGARVAITVGWTEGSRVSSTVGSLDGDAGTVGSAGVAVL